MPPLNLTPSPRVGRSQKDPLRGLNISSDRSSGSLVGVHCCQSPGLGLGAVGCSAQPWRTPRHSKAKATKVSGCGQACGTASPAPAARRRTVDSSPSVHVKMGHFWLSTPVSLRTLQMGWARLPIASAEPASRALVCVGWVVLCQLPLFFCLRHLFLSVPLPQHLPLQTFGPAFSSGSLSKKMLKPWHGRGHISWGSA